MASAARISVGTVATSLVTGTDTDEVLGRDVVITNRGTVAVFLGGAAVTIADGYELSVGGTIPLVLSARDTLFGIAVSVQRVDVLSLGV